MTDIQKQFAEAFKAAGETLTEEILPLFSQILEEDMGDDPEKMSAFMESITTPKELPQTSTEIQVAMLQETVLQLTELLMGGV